MPVPWLRVFDAALSVAEIVRRVSNRPAVTAGEPRGSTSQQAIGPPVEAHLTGVVVAALKEAFDRDHQRIQLEREQRQAERARAERLLRLEVARQVADRELARLRLVAGFAVASWLVTVLGAGLTTVLGLAARMWLGAGWMFLLAAVAAAFAGQTAVTTDLARAPESDDRLGPPAGGGAALAAPWLLVAGLAAIAVAVLIR